VSEDRNRCVVYRETPGNVGVSVRVVDRNNFNLGEAKIAFNVNVSSEMLERSLRLSEGWARWEDALALREKGEVETALLQAQQAAEDMIAGGIRTEVFRGELELFRQLRDNYFRALETASIAAGLRRDGRLEEALLQYRRARTFYVHASIERNIEELESTLRQERELKEKAALLAREAERLAKAEDLAGAIDKYQESLSFYSDPEVRAAQAEVDGRQKAIQRRVGLAQTTRDIGLTLESQDNLEEALAKLTEARDIWLLPDIVSNIERVQLKIANQQRQKNEADRLARDAAQLEGRGLEGQGDSNVLAQALEKYRQSAQVWKEPSVDRAIERVASHIARINEDTVRANFLVRQAQVLEREGRLNEALDKYFQAQNVRQSNEAESKIEEVTRRRDARRKLLGEARGYYARAEELEKQERLDEALKNALAGKTLLLSADIVGEERIAGDLSVAVNRLETR